MDAGDERQGMDARDGRRLLMQEVDAKDVRRVWTQGMDAGVDAKE